MALAIVLTISYWTLWFTARSVVASNDRPAYREFENAFPLADGWLVLCLALGVVTLARGGRTTLLWLLGAGSAAVYLFCMDVLYDLERDIWWSSGAGGWIELLINVLTLILGALLLAWAWRHRRALLREP